MIKVLAVDDEPLALQQLMVYISKTPFLELAGSCTSAKKALELMDSNPVQAIFLDINMPGMSGMDLAKEMNEMKGGQHPLIVFTTAYQEFAIEGYKVDAVDYLMKPFSFEEFSQAAARLKSRIELMEKAGSGNLLQTDDSMFFKTGYKIVRIKSTDIFYIESMGEYMKIYTQVAGKLTCTLVLHTMSSMMSLLPSGKFMRIHRSFIINLSKLQSVELKRAILSNGSVIPIGDNYRAQFKEWLESSEKSVSLE